MGSGLKYNIIKQISKVSYNVLKLLPTGGKSYPGYIFIKNAGIESLEKLSKEQIENGSILITGTNGKTTTTTMLIELLSNDTTISSSVDNNTIYSLTTALLSKKSKLGIFEYGIRDVKHGTPDLVEKYIKPEAVIYTNISREHTQVLGVKNSFEDYVHAKKLLSKDMKNKIVITNADDPITCSIGMEKEKDGHVIYYGLELNDLNDLINNNTTCPICKKQLNYSQQYMNQRGKYSCECGFKRKEPNVRITKHIIKDNKTFITVEGTSYNFFTKENVSFNVELTLPLFGLHNTYNVLAAITTYTTFTLNPENIEHKLKEYFNSLNNSILPPGRFEIVNYKNKIIGIGQGDNGDALNVNYMYSKYFIHDNDYEFIYCTPDENEEEIFEDHLNTLKQIMPTQISVLPGRVSVNVAQKYYKKIKDNNLNAEFHPVDYDFSKRVNKIVDLINKSKFKYIIVSGCGEEHAVWNKTLEILKRES